MEQTVKDMGDLVDKGDFQQVSFALLLGRHADPSTLHSSVATHRLLDWATRRKYLLG